MAEAATPIAHQSVQPLEKAGPGRDARRRGTTPMSGPFERLKRESRPVSAYPEVKLAGEQSGNPQQTAMLRRTVSTRGPSGARASGSRRALDLAPLRRASAQENADLRSIHAVQDPLLGNAALAGHRQTPPRQVEFIDRVRIRV